MNHLSSAHWQLKAVVNNMNEIMETKMQCLTCQGQGYIIETRTEPGCCGDLDSGGACRGDCAIPVEVPEQVGCQDCEGTGYNLPERKTQ